MDYRDFVLVLRTGELNENNETRSCKVQVFDSPVGQGEKEDDVKIPNDFNTSIRDLENRMFDIDEQLLMEFGEIIGNILLPDYARKLYSQSYVRLRENEGLRLRLRLDDTLADIPWECALVRDARGELTSSGFLALNPKVSVVRHEALPVPGDWFEAPGVRRVFVVMASPENDLPGLPGEQQKLKAVLSGVSGIEAEYRPDYSAGVPNGFPSATLADLAQGLMKKTDVFHFAGHGQFKLLQLGAQRGTFTGEGAIVLADRENRPFFLPADRLAEMLRQRGVRLAVLGACEGARRDGHNVWSSVAAALLKAEIPAVVAMQFKIFDDLSAEFSSAFYRALIAGLTVDEAVSRGRASIRLKALQEGRQNVRDWCTPVLYLRSPGGTVFNPVSDEKAVIEAQSALDNIKQSVTEIVKSGRGIGTIIRGPKSTPTKVEQKVTEGMAGLLVGGIRFGSEGGTLSVDQNVKTVSGTMIGASDPVSLLYEKLGSSMTGNALAKPPAATCPNPLCRRAVKPDWKFCGACGTPLQCPNCHFHFDDVVRACPACGTKVQVG